MDRARLACVFAYALLAACGNDHGFDTGADLGVDAGGVDGITVAPAQGSLPCEIQAILADRCTGCHGTTLAGGAPIHLVSYADLLGKTESGKQVAQRCVERIMAMQMPPSPAASLSASDAATFSAWVAAGTPSGTCAPPPPGPFDGPPVCTSGTMWTGGNHGSAVMHPGVACITCHARAGGDDAPQFKVAGTAFPTGHEPDDCDGATPATVEVTDAKGKVFKLSTNPAGNFFSTSAIAFPIHVAVLANGKRRAMTASPPTGDCNNCHTQDGANMAPGRITLP
jgi:hypothetical protein